MNRILSNRLVRYGFIFLFVCIIVYDFYYIPNTQKQAEEEITVPSDYRYCPDSKYVDALGEKWTNEFWAANPEATIEEWTIEWNRIARAMNCSIYVRTPEEAQRTLDIRGKLP